MIQSTSDLVGLIVAGGIALLCLVLGIVLLKGRGAMLIAGYNTMSETERAKYNIKKICRATGVYMLVTAAWIILLTYCGIRGIVPLLYALIGAFIVVTIVFMIWMSTSRRFKNNHEPGGNTLT